MASPAVELLAEILVPSVLTGFGTYGLAGTEFLRRRVEYVKQPCLLPENGVGPLVLGKFH